MERRKAIEEVYRISEIYSKLRRNEIKKEEIKRIAEGYLKEKNIGMIEKLSNLIFARFGEEEKMEWAKKLEKEGFEDLVPLNYRKIIKGF